MTSGRSPTALHRSYANDVFRVSTIQGQRYFFKVYQRDWRSPSDVAWELRIHRHLLASAVSVATPVDRQDGGALSILEAAEGQRAAVLFVEAPGRKPQ